MIVGKGWVWAFAWVFMLLSVPTLQAEGWRLQKIGGRDYLPLSQVAGFYRMRGGSFGAKGVALISEGRRMEFQIGSREAKLDGVKHWLSFPVISYGGRPYLSRMDLSKTIDPVMRPNRIRTLEPLRTVVLDPGHGGHDRGAVNRLGYEKNYNLDLSRRIRSYLQKAGYRVLITRSRDEFIPLEDRPAKAAGLGKGTIFVSIHFNYSDRTGTGATGFETYALTPQGAPNSNDAFLIQQSFSAESGHRTDHASMALATAIQHAMLGRVPMFDRGVKRARFAVLRRAVTPAVLVEGGFMSNGREARAIHSGPWRERLAESIAKGIIEFGELTKTGAIPKFLAKYREEMEPLPEGEEFQYNPLAGIAVAYQQGFPYARGWRELLIAPLSEDVSAFKLEYGSSGWGQLEEWTKYFGDVGGVAKDAASKENFEHDDWARLVSKVPGVQTYWQLFSMQQEEEKFELYPVIGGPISHGEETEVIPQIIEISGGAL